MFSVIQKSVRGSGLRAAFQTLSLKAQATSLKSETWIISYNFELQTGFNVNK